MNKLEKKGRYLFRRDDPKVTLDAECQRVGETFCTAREKAGIEDFHLHDARHCFASALVMDGTDIMVVKDLLGHKHLDMTLRYSHLSPQSKMKAVNVLDRVWSQNPPQENQGKQKAVVISGRFGE